MRHRKANRKLNRTASHRKALIANLTGALLRHEQITTTLAKAKTLRPFVEKIISKARIDNLQQRRVVIAKIKDLQIVKKLFAKIGPRYKDRPGGYTRIIKAGYRKGDDSPMAVIELLDRDVEEKGKIDKENKQQEQNNS